MEHRLHPIHPPAGATLLLAGLLFLSGCGGDAPPVVDGVAVPDRVDYNLHVRSILSENCFACHGPDAMTREAGLRLDTEESAYGPLGEEGDRRAIVPGNLRRSEVYHRITSNDPDYRMPTPDSNLRLTEWEISVLTRWIDQGAEYKPHWSLIPPAEPDLPAVRNDDWPVTPVDYFILARLEEESLEPSPDAAREKWLRRVSFDLTGLPPSIEELDRFLQDDSPQAWERAVDRLLDSEAYGERMASEWLDLASYADTHGYQDDGANEHWPWREWVIHAFNRNMPFDRFATWQLAGDLLPGATREQKLATGFGRAHQQSQEGGIIGEEYRVEYVADRVYTVGTTFLGKTMQCARCHDHKYDPISEVDYYRFAAFFDNINETGQIPNAGMAGPTILLPDEETERVMEYLGGRIESKERELADMATHRADDFLRWYAGAGRELDALRPESDGVVASIDTGDLFGDSIRVHTPAGPDFARIVGELATVEGVNGNALEFSHGNYLNLGDLGRFERTEPFSLGFRVRPSDSFREVPVLVKTGAIFIGYRGYDVSLFDNRVSFRLSHGWPYNSIQVLTLDPIGTDEWSHIVVTYDGSSRADGISIYINGERQPLHTEHDDLFKTIKIPPYQARYSSQDFLIGYRHSFENLNYRGMRLDDIRIFDRTLSGLEAAALAGNEQHLLLAESELHEVTEERRERLLEHFLLREDRAWRQAAEELRDLRRELHSVTDTLREVMVMRERLNRRTSYVRERGMYEQLGEEVEPGVPSNILEFPEEFPRNRLGLAKWILHPDNPLTARVVVNRYWQLFFGEGLVETPDDFGNQGALPTHPELLDWLAVRFRENGWDIRELLREIALSRTYRQSSVTTPEMRESDPRNRLLARGPRHRLPAEMIRDNALAVSGLLVEKIGGPSVFPYQPEGLWEETTSGRHLTEYVQDEGEALYRRSLYTFWKRTSPPPGMTTFDAAMRTHPSAQRQETSTPLQALHTLNDPIYIEASRHLAERMMKEAGGELRDQISFAFRAATARYPRQEELDLLTALYEEELQVYREDPDSAVAFLQVGDSPFDRELDSPELAARAIVAGTILNLDETLTKE